MFTNVVKADKIADFEAFVSTFRGAVESLIKDGKLDAEEGKAYEGFRVIKQDGASGDSVTYLFVMDPYVAASSYSLSEYLTRGLGKEKAGEQLAIFKSCLAGPQTPFLGIVQ